MRSVTCIATCDISLTCRLRSWEKATRFTVIWTIFVVLALFYTIPIGAVQAIIEVQRLESIGFFRALIRIEIGRAHV